MSKNIKNAELTVEFAERSQPVIFHTEDTQGGHKAIYLVQDVKIKNSIGEGSALSLAAFVGEGSGLRKCLRAIVVVPIDHPIAAMKVGAIVSTASIKLWRSTDPFKDKSSEEGGYPSQAVLNPKTGMITTRDSMPVFEHRLVVVANPEKTYEYDLTVEGETGNATAAEVSTYLQTEWNVEEDRANNAAQLDFVVAPVEKMQSN